MGKGLKTVIPSIFADILLKGVKKRTLISWIDSLGLLKRQGYLVGARILNFCDTAILRIRYYKM
jgi:hypothetical protein